MPTPLGHAGAGLIVHVLAARDRAELASPARAALIVGAAVAPDLDLLLRWFDGRNHHQAESHSLGCALLAGLAGALIAFGARWIGPGRTALATSAAWMSHVVLDYFGKDTNPPIGLPALWPFGLTYYKFPHPVFMEIGRTLDVPTLLHDVVAAAWELAILSPLLFLAWRARARVTRHFFAR
jgi:membrane-bound metal-dependent hydrolase YbcI (DUF457 family)